MGIDYAVNWYYNIDKRKKERDEDWILPTSLTKNVLRQVGNVVEIDVGGETENTSLTGGLHHSAARSTASRPRTLPSR
jgi:hypothetical protein